MRLSASKPASNLISVQGFPAIWTGEQSLPNYFENARLQPSVKLKIDPLSTGMGSCLLARARKMLRSLLLRLFSRDLAFIVILHLFAP
jgi:hypothetical protein